MEKEAKISHKKILPSSVLARRTLFQIIFVSALFSIVLTIIQVYIDYRSSSSAAETRIMNLEDTILPTFEKSMWLLEDNIVTAQLEGIIQMPYVEYSAIYNANNKKKISYGGVESKVTKEFRYAMKHDVLDSPDSIKIGSLLVMVGYNALFWDVIKRTGIVLLG